MTPTDDDRVTAIRARMAHDFQGALSEAREFAGQSPASLPARKLLAFLLNFQKDIEGAIEVLRDAREMAPHDSEIVFNLGYCEMQRGQFDVAASHFGGSVGRSGGLTDCLLALCEDWQGDSQTAAERIRRLTRQQPGDPAALYLLFRLGTSSDRSAARAALGKVLGRPEQRAKLVSFVNSYDIPQWRKLDDKASLTRMLRFHDRGPAPGSLPNYPETFIMPDDRKALLAAAGTATWIAKPTALFGGQNVILTRDPADIPQDGGWIAQRYIDDPLLVRKTKAHVRLYLVITGLAPFVVCLYGNAIVRFAPQTYDTSEDGLAADAAHITNTARYRHDETLAARAAVSSLSEYLVEAGRGALKSQQLADELLALARSLSGVIERECLRDAAFPATARAIPPKLLGLDVLFDRSGKGWLLEVERYPALSDASIAGGKVQSQFMVDLCRLLLTGHAEAPAWTKL